MKRVFSRVAARKSYKQFENIPKLTVNWNMPFPRPVEFWGSNEGLLDIRGVPEICYVQIEKWVDESISKLDLNLLTLGKDAVAKICGIHVARILFKINDMNYIDPEGWREWEHLTASGLDLYYCFAGLYRDALVDKYPSLVKENYFKMDFFTAYECFEYTYCKLLWDLCYYRRFEPVKNCEVAEEMLTRELKLRLPELYPKLCMDVVYLIREFI